MCHGVISMQLWSLWVNGCDSSGAYCTKLLPEKNSGYFNWSFQFLLMVKSMVNSCLPEFSHFTRVSSPVKVLCNGPQILIWFQTILLITKPHFQTWCSLNRLKSTSFQAFQIILDFFSQMLSNPWVKYFLNELEMKWN